jgi:hypothetical protein
LARFTAKTGNTQFDTWTFAFVPTTTATNVTAQTLPSNGVTSDYADQASSSAANATFDSAGSAFVGAIAPNGTDWTSGWITNAAN